MKLTRRSLFALAFAPLLPKPHTIDVDPVADEPEPDFATLQADHFKHAWSFCRALCRMELCAVKEKHPLTWRRLQFSGVALYGYGAAICYGVGTHGYCKAEVQRLRSLFGPRVVEAYKTPKGRCFVALVKGESVAAIRAEIEGHRRANALEPRHKPPAADE